MNLTYSTPNGIHHARCIGAEPTGFTGWLAARLGTSKWCVAPRMTSRLRVRYTVTITQKRYAALYHEWLGLALAHLMFGLPAPTGAPARVRVEYLGDDDPELLPYECLLDEAAPDPDDFADVLADLRRDGVAIVGGGAAPGFRVTWAGDGKITDFDLTAQHDSGRLPVGPTVGISEIAP